MSDDEVTRRSFLVALSECLGIAWAGLDWPQIANAAHEAHAAAQASADARISFLTTAEAADVDAIAAQIIPSDGTPGAREAGVVYFIDRALATFFARMADPFRTQLAEFQAACRAQNPDAPAFAALTSDRQIAFLKTVEDTPFFDQIRMLTLCGMFSSPQYGGNRDGVGWRLIGFEDQHVFQPPFGYYDRDYPGFVVDRAQAK